MTKIVENKDKDMSDIENQLDEAVGAQDSLKPNSAPVSDPKSKAEAMASIVGMALAVPADKFNAYWRECLNQYQKLRGEGPGDAGSNQATQNMHPSDAEGSGGAGVKMPPTKVPGATFTNITKEDLETIISGTQLTEEDTTKITSLFEAAVSLKVSLIEAEVIDRLEKENEERIEAFMEETKANLDAYIDYAVDNWIGENEVAIVDTLRLENTEQFMSKLKDLFTESYIDVPEERLDIVREMSEHVVEVEDALDEAIKTIAEQQAILDEITQEKTVESMTEGLTLADKEKFKTLIESVEFDGNSEAYEKKLKIVKENYFSKKAPPKTSGDVNVLNENTDGFVEKRQIYVDPLVEAAARVLKKTG